MTTKPAITSAAPRCTLRAWSPSICNTTRIAAELTDENIELMYNHGPLHDIGKVGIPDVYPLNPVSSRPPSSRS